MEEPRWCNGAEEYRLVQGLIRTGRPQEALERACQALSNGRMARRQAARLHSLVCSIYIEELQQACPQAVLHGEEAVRLSALAGDVWLKCDAMARLVHAYCQIGDVTRARQAVADIADEVAKNEGALVDGSAGLYVLKATVAIVEGKADESLRALAEAETIAEQLYPESRDRIRQQRVDMLLEQGKYAEARRLLETIPQPPTEELAETGSLGIERAWLALGESHMDQARLLLEQVSQHTENDAEFDTQAQCLLLRALAEEPTNRAEARRLARVALHRSFAAGRLDLARRFRRRLSHLLQ